MPTMVLRYKGSGDRAAAERRLREQLPGLTLTPKTRDYLEAGVPAGYLAALTAHPEWEVRPTVYAGVPPLTFTVDHLRNLVASRAK